MRISILLILVIACFSCNTATESTSEPVNVVSPAGSPSNFETNDSSFLKLKIKESGFEVDFLKQSAVLQNSNSLDSFFKNNTNRISKEKVVVTGLDTAKNNKELLDILKKYGIEEFRVNTEKQ